MNEKYLNLLSFVDKSVEEINLILQSKETVESTISTVRECVEYSSAVSKGNQ